MFLLGDPAGDLDHVGFCNWPQLSPLILSPLFPLGNIAGPLACCSSLARGGLITLAFNPFVMFQTVFFERAFAFSFQTLCTPSCRPLLPPDALLAGGEFKSLSFCCMNPLSESDITDEVNASAQQKGKQCNNRAARSPVPFA